MTKHPDGSSIPVHGAENFSVSERAEAIPHEERVAVTREDLRAPDTFEKGEALIIPIVNVRDIRDPKDGEIGALYPEQAAEFETRIQTFMDKIYQELPEDERQNIDIVVLAGETDLVTPGADGLHNSHQRAVETGDHAIAGIKKSMEQYGIDSEKSLITQHDRPVSITQLNDIKLLHPLDSEGDKKYLDFLVEKYGTAGRKLWMVFEDDSEKETREKLGAEGPTEIADRMGHIMDISSTIADLCQRDDPERRVIVLTLGHYDNISPWIKKHLMGIDPAKGFVPIEKGGGLVVKRAVDKTASTKIGNTTFPVEFEPLA